MSEELEELLSGGRWKQQTSVTYKAPRNAPLHALHSVPRRDGGVGARIATISRNAISNRSRIEQAEAQLKLRWRR